MSAEFLSPKDQRQSDTGKAELRGPFLRDSGLPLNVLRRLDWDPSVLRGDPQGRPPGVAPRRMGALACIIACSQFTLNWWHLIQIWFSNNFERKTDRMVKSDPTFLLLFIHNFSLNCQLTPSDRQRHKHILFKPYGDPYIDSITSCAENWQARRTPETPAFYSVPHWPASPQGVRRCVSVPSRDPALSPRTSSLRHSITGSQTHLGGVSFFSGICWRI